MKTKAPGPKFLTVSEMPYVREPCVQCPWAVSNHGRRHPHGFFTKKNLRRLWNQIRGGGGVQTCHMTDDGHPDHCAPPGATKHECMGSLILIWRELRKAEQAAGPEGELTPEGIDTYLGDPANRTGLKKMGLAYYCISRNMGYGTPLLPRIDKILLDDERYGRPQ